MAKVEESVVAGASLAEAWDAYFDQRGWGAWVDGFQAVLDSSGYPDTGTTLRWRSIPAGRGEVTERVLEHEHRRSHRVEFSNPAMSGELAVAFVIEGEGTRITQTLTYGLSARGPMSVLASLLFVRSQVRRSVQRSLLNLKVYIEETAHFSRR